MLQQDTIRTPRGAAQMVYRAGAGPQVVWLHGVSGASADDPFIAELAKHFSVFAPVAPGFNDLNEIGDIDDIHDLALHYDDLLTAAGIARAPIIGHSFGAMIAAEIAAHFPGRASHLALLSPVGLWDDSDPVPDLFARPFQAVSSFLWEGAAADSAGAAEVAKAKPRSSYEINAAAGSREQAVEELVRLAQGLTAVAKFMWPIPDKGLARRLYRITARTLVVAGERDAFMPHRYPNDFAAAIAGAKLVKLPTSHMLPYERPAEVARLLRDFLST